MKNNKFPDPADFPNGDEIDSITVEEPEDAYDELEADDREVLD